MKKLSVNYFLNLIYEILLIAVPLIMTPYISRVLLPEGVGQYSYCVSIVSYFTTAATFGFATYSERQIAKYQNNVGGQISETSEIVIDKLILTLIVGVAYCVILFSGVFKEYTKLLWILLINIVSIPFDISFYFKGNENFLIIVSRNILIKIITIALVFIFIKTSNDLWIYALINALSIFISNASLWFNYMSKCIKNYENIHISLRNCLNHFKEAFIYFIPSIAISISSMIDNTLIGLLVTGEVENQTGEIVKNSDVQNGYYSQASKIVKMAMTVVSSLATVILPRNSFEFERDNIENAKRNMYWAFNTIFIVGFPMCFGLIAIANNLVPWFLGTGYEECIVLLIILTPMVVINGITALVGYSWLIPKGEVKKFTVVVCVISVTNTITSIILIPVFYAMGAILGTLFSEMIGTLICLILVRRHINLIKVFQMNFKYLIYSIIMGGIVLLVSHFLDSSIINTIILIFVGVLIYAILLLLFKDQYFMNVIKKIVKKFRNRKGGVEN